MTELNQEEVWELSEETCHVALTRAHLNVQEIMDRVRSPAAGAIVLFAGEFTNSHPQRFILAYTNV